MIDAKRYLQQIRLYDAQINAKIEERQRLKDMILKITPTMKDDTSSGGNSSQDELGNAVAKIVDLESEIDMLVDRYVYLKRNVCSELDKITIPDQYEVLHKRYIQYKTWETIACEMNMTYRNVCYIHGKALQTMHEILKGE